MNIEEAIDNLLMLKYFIEQEKENNYKEYITAIETVLNELDKDNNIISDLQNEVTLKQCELDNKDKIINEIAEMLVKDHEWFYSEFDNYTKQDFIDYFTKKVEGK